MEALIHKKRFVAVEFVTLAGVMNGHKLIEFRASFELRAVS